MGSLLIRSKQKKHPFSWWFSFAINLGSFAINSVQFFSLAINLGRRGFSFAIYMGQIRSLIAGPQPGCFRKRAVTGTG